MPPRRKRAGATDDDQRGVLARGHGALELSQHFFDGDQGLGHVRRTASEHRVLDGERGDTAVSSSSNRAHHVERFP